MELHQQFRRNVRGFYAWLGSTLLLGVAPIAAGMLIDRGTPLSRAVGVLVGVAGFLPWMWLLFSIVRRGDEFLQRIHLVAITITATFGLMLLIAIGWLVRARFIEPPDYMLIWVVWLAAWVVVLLGTKRYFERAR